MSNRLTDTEKWNDPWFCSLTPQYKLFWLYLCDNSSLAGIWRVNWPLVKFHCWNEEPYNPDIFGGRIRVLNEQKWFIEKVILFQQKINSLDDLSPNSNNAHLGIVRELVKEGILNEGYIPPTKGLNEAPGKGKVKVEVKVKEEGVLGEETKKEFPYLQNKEFVACFNDYLAMRKKIRRPATTRAEGIALKSLHEHPIEIAIKMLEQSVMNSWQGIFPLKETHKSPTNPKSFEERQANVQKVLDDFRKNGR